MLFKRKIRTRLTQLHSPPTPDIIEVLEHDAWKKQQQRRAKDRKQYVKPHEIKVGDQVLLKQRKTKSQPPYDPIPYTVIEVVGHQITASRKHQTLTRDAQKWKRISTKPPSNYDQHRHRRAQIQLHDDEDDWLTFGDIGIWEHSQTADELAPGSLVTVEEGEATLQVPRRSTRTRRRPSRYNEYKMAGTR